MRRSTILGVGVVVAAVVWWLHDPATPDTAEVTDNDRVEHADHAKRTGAMHDVIKRSGTASQIADGVTITGKVIDEFDAAVANVEVVFRGDDGEESVQSGADGSYRIELAPGRYRAFVRDDEYLSIGRVQRDRLPGAADGDKVNAPDEAAMSLVVANRDLAHVDLPVVGGGTIVGHVEDGSGNPVAHAVVRAVGPVKPVLGTDIAETDATGAYRLQVPRGRWRLDATHARYAGTVGAQSIQVDRGHQIEVDLTLVAGCVISGRVVGADGKPANEGAIESQWGTTDTEFAPTGKISSDGTFRWVTTRETAIKLRAWPWKSPPSQALEFPCHDGAYFGNVVFQIPTRSADIEGTLADAAGNPVPLAFLDLAPLDPGGIPQQERTDENGHWGVFFMPAGRYRVTAYAQGLGVVSTIVSSPQHDVRLALSGTGRLDGTTKELAGGSFELQLVSCNFEGRTLPIPDDTRIVSVVDGKFSIEGVPACSLSAMARSKGIAKAIHVQITNGGNASTEIAFVPDPEPEPQVIHDADELDVPDDDEVRGVPAPDTLDGDDTIDEPDDPTEN